MGAASRPAQHSPCWYCTINKRKMPLIRNTEGSTSSGRGGGGSGWSDNSGSTKIDAAGDSDRDKVPTEALQDALWTG